MLFEEQKNGVVLTQVKGENFLLLPEKAIYWEAKKMLLIADLHLGKTTHFRSNGIAVPKEVPNKNWMLLDQLIGDYEVERLCFLGDLFHSTFNHEWDVFAQWVKRHHQIRFELVLGNHDILEPIAYEQLGFKTVDKLNEMPFVFTHEPQECEEGYNLAGHIHPGIRLKGKARQTHRSACFYFGEKGGILPAFGAFTGMANVKPTKNSQIFIVVNERVMKL